MNAYKYINMCLFMQIAFTLNFYQYHEEDDTTES